MVAGAVGVGDIGRGGEAVRPEDTGKNTLALWLITWYSITNIGYK